jgi:urease accessory protein
VISSVSAAFLLLVDSRLPAGGHAHSGGLETAIALGVVEDVASLGKFLLGRLSTAGAVSATFAAASAPAEASLSELDTELDARMPSATARVVSRAQGRALLRVAGRAWPDPRYTELGQRPHHSIALGTAVAAAGGTPADAALAAATSAVTGPASAAVRLLALDPIEVTELLARLTDQIDAVAAAAARAARDSGLTMLPAWSAPALDAYAELHAAAEVKLFAS